MENVEVPVKLPVRQQKSVRPMDEDEDQEVAVNTFSLDSVADSVFHRKKKIAAEFDGDDADDEEDNPLVNQLTVLDEEEILVDSEDMEDWLKKLHIRTQHLVGKVTLNAMGRLAATNHVATALTRFKGKVKIDSSGKRLAFEENSNGLVDTEQVQSTLECSEMATTTTEIIRNATETTNSLTKEENKKVLKQSSKTETKTQIKRREMTSAGTKATPSNDVRKSRAAKTPPILPAPTKTAAVAAVPRKTNKVNPAVKNVRSVTKSKVIN